MIIFRAKSMHKDVSYPLLSKQPGKSIKYVPSRPGYFLYVGPAAMLGEKVWD